MPNLEFPLPLDLNRVHQILSTHPEFSNRLVDLTVATITLSAEKHGDRTMLFNKAAGVTVTMPKATGSGLRYRFLVKSLATSNSYIVKVGNTTDIIQGSVLVSDTDTAGTATAFSAAADSDTITLNRGTTGSVTIGEWLVLEDIASGVYAVNGILSNTGNGATPFTAAV
jgi:hypothetical protein